MRQQRTNLPLSMKRYGDTAVIRGVGKYGLGLGEWSPTDSAVGSLFRSLGSHFGGDALGTLGSKAGNWLSKVIGLGTYQVESNTILAGLNGSQVPAMHSVNDSVIVRHREYVGAITAEAGYVNQTFALNPGNKKLFPWLSTIAANYRMWKLRGAVMEFKSMASLMSASANTGSVMMTTNYNVYDPPFDSVMQILNNTFTTNAKPFETFVHPIECAQHLEPTKWLYIRNHAAPVNQDQRLYDMGLFQIAVEGCPTTGPTIGQLWITYEVELAKPIMYGSLGMDSALYCAGIAGTITGAGTQKLSLVGTSQTYTVATGTQVFNVGINDYDAYMASDTWAYLPPGSYGLYRIIIDMRTINNVLTDLAGTLPAGPQFVAVPAYPDVAGPYANSSVTSFRSSNIGHFECIFKVLNSALKCQLPYVTMTVSGATTYNATIRLEQVPYNEYQVASGGPIVGAVNEKLKYAPESHALATIEEEEKYPETMVALNGDDEPKDVQVSSLSTTFAPTVLRSLGLSKSTIDLPTLKRA